jgi:L-glyceraldehyde 3-phosphate reductase
MGTRLLIHQPNYNMFDRWVEDGLLDTLEEKGVGCIVFSPLAQGLLTNRYLQGIPVDSRAAKPRSYLHPEDVTDEKVAKVRKLNEIAKQRGQTMAELSLAWVLRKKQVTTALVGASRVQQVDDNVAALKNLSFTAEELKAIDDILK